MSRGGGSRQPRWSPVRHARRASWGHRRGQALALVAISALVTACTAFAPVYDRAMQQALADTLLDRAGPADRTVAVVAESKDYPGDTADSLDPREIAALIPRDVAARLEPIVLGRAASVTPTQGEVPPGGPLVWREGACDHVDVLDGACPNAPGEVLVSEADVDNFGVDVGSVLRVRPANADERAVRLEVVGVYAPRDETWWQGERTVGLSSIFLGTDPSATHDAWLTAESTFDEAPVLTGETSRAGAPVRAATAGVDDVVALGEQARALSREVRGGSYDLQVRTGVDELAADVRSQVQQAHRTVPLLVAPMAVLSVFVLWLVLAAATAQRRGEVAVARLRGRRPSGVVGLLLLELLPALLIGVVPGAAAAVAGGAVVGALLPGNAPLEVAPGFVVAVLLAVAALVLTTLAAAVRTAREPLHDVVGSGSPPSRRWALGAVDAFILAGVGTGVIAFVTGSLQGPLALAGPALLALFAGLVLAHLAIPVAARAGRGLLRRGRFVAGVSLLETGRRRETRAVIAVLTVAGALAVFSVDALAIGERNRANASQQDAGAPVVLEVAGRDLDGVRAALQSADPTGRRGTAVLVTRDTLAVDAPAFDRIAFFPRGAPTAAEWRAIAPPDVEPVVLQGSHVTIDVRPAPDLASRDIFGSEVQVDLGLVVTSGTGVRRTIDLGPLPQAGESRTLEGDASGCGNGCPLAAVQLTTAQGVVVQGGLDLSDLRVDGQPVDLGTSAGDWNTTEDEDTLVRATGAGPDGVLRLELDVGGFYPVEVSPAWVPGRLPALLPDGREDPLGLVVTGVDGTDRPADDAGRVLLVPTMRRRSALVDLDAATRGADITFDTRVEAWLVDDPTLEAAVTTTLQDAGIAVTAVRRHAVIQQAYDDSVASWSLALGAAVAPAVVLLALLVLVVLAVIGWRSRARDLAVLRLDGVARSTTRRLAVRAELPAVLLGIVGGVGAGLAGAVLAMPDVAFFPTPPQVPVVDTATSWPAVLWVAAACLAVLPAAAALGGVVVARRAHLERVKEGV